MILFSLVAALVAAQPATNGEKGHPMSQDNRTYVAIIRLTSGALDSPTLAKRDGEIRLWGKELREKGVVLEPRMLGTERADLGSRPAAERSTKQEVAALLFLEAPDFIAARAVAETHPGLRYGATVELRPWSLPGPK